MTGSTRTSAAHRTQGLHHLGLTVADLNASSRFFIEALGFRVVSERPAYPARFLSDGTIMLTLWQRHGQGEFDRKANSGLHHFALQMADQTALESTYLELSTRDDVSVEFAPEPLGTGGVRHMMCLIPGGIRLELIALAPEHEEADSDSESENSESENGESQDGFRDPEDDPKGSKVAFTPSVVAHQEQHGSRASYERRLARHDWPSVVTPELAKFIGERDSFYFATASASGQPYVQHRGGRAGFLRVLDEGRLAFADYRGNKQYISVGNLDDNDKAFIFLMDYAHQRRIKIWGRAEVVEDPLVTALVDEGDRVHAERAIVFHVRAWDENCSKHIPIKRAVRDGEGIECHVHHIA